MLTRDQLHRLIDSIPEDRLPAVEAALEPLADPLARALLLAPEDDEPLSDEERRLIEEARSEAEEAGYLTHDDVKSRHVPT